MFGEDIRCHKETMAGCAFSYNHISVNNGAYGDDSLTGELPHTV